MNGAVLQTASLWSNIPMLSSGGGGGFCSTPGSPRISLTMEPRHGRNHGIRRVMSENDVIAASRGLGGAGSRSFSSASISEDEMDWLSNPCGTFQKENLSQSYGGDGSSNKSGKIGEYYEKMLRMNPGDPLLLRNYATYLHEVEGNTERAEEYYGRAILANPGDGEVLSMYAKLIWEAWGDGARAKCYHDRAVSASPDNCVVLGSFAQFLWETDKDEEEEMAKRAEGDKAVMVAAF